jgi:DnaJ domain
MSRAPKDYYAVLHVQPGAPVEIIRASYRTLMQRLKAHPDLGGDAAAAAEINEAYAVLKDDAKRAAYDAERSAARPASAPGGGTSGAARTRDREHSAPAPSRAADAGTSCAFCGWPPPSTDRHSDDRCTRCASPLSRALPLIETSERAHRGVHRVTKDEPLRFFTDWQTSTGHAGVLVDLSLTGLRFAAQEPLEKERLVRVECALFSAVARVARCERGRELLFQIGAEFVTVLFHRQRGSLVSIPV